MNREIRFSYLEFDDDGHVSTEDKALIAAARAATTYAYAPYSKFNVAAAARLANGQIITATNQENASYPVGICAERSLLATIGALYPNVPVDCIAVTYNNQNGNSQKPVFPCGICRQSLLEYESRTNADIRLLITGFTGKVIVLEKAGQLLPFSFSAVDMD